MFLGSMLIFPVFPSRFLTRSYFRRKARWKIQPTSQKFLDCYRNGFLVLRTLNDRDEMIGDVDCLIPEGLQCSWWVESLIQVSILRLSFPDTLACNELHVTGRLTPFKSIYQYQTKSIVQR